MNLNSQTIILLIVLIQQSNGQVFLSMCSRQSYTACVNTDGCELVKTPEMQCYGSCYSYDESKCSNHKNCYWKINQCAEIQSCNSLKSESDCTSQEPCYWDNIQVCQDAKKDNNSSTILGFLFSYVLSYLIL
ncbi:hypothetical protein ABPG72_014809 [Tetrahymena utriculariae]